PRGPAPDEAAPAELITADPAKRLVLGRHVGVLPVAHEEMPCRLAEGVVLTLDGIVALVQIRLAATAVGELPRLQPLGDVVLAVLHMPAALDYEGAQPPLAQLLGGPAPGDAGADDDGERGLRTLVIERGRHEE